MKNKTKIKKCKHSPVIEGKDIFCYKCGNKVGKIRNDETKSKGGKNGN